MIGRFTFDRLATTLLFTAIAATACLMPAQNDTWWQLRAGQEMWARGELLRHDTFSHTVAGAFWPNHEWLSQVVLYGAYAAGGAALVTLLCAVVVTAAWALVWRLTPAPPKTKLLLVAFVIACASTSWSPRPQVFSLLLVVATVALLRSRRYQWLPPLFFVWANLHGAVLLGVLLLATGVVAAYVERETKLSRIRLVVCAALAVVATLATPLGWHFWIEIGESLSRIRQLGIDEWTPPGLTDLAQLPFWTMIVALVGSALVRGPALWRSATACRAGQLTLCGCALMLAPAALTAARNVPPFLMLAVPALAALWAGFWNAPETLARSEAPAPRRLPRREHPRVNVAIAAAAVVIAVATVSSAYAKGVRRLNWTPLPAASLAALDRCDGNLYNRYDEGGYLIWFAPRHKVFVDGRQDPYSPAFIRAHIEAEATGEVDALFARYAIRCAYLPAQSRVSDALVESGWHPLYRDAVWTVLARDEPAALARR
jgi:hypothetical protein